MIAWLVRFLMVIAGAILSLFVAREELNFETLQMVIAVVLFTLIITILAFWPALKNLFSRRKK